MFEWYRERFLAGRDFSSIAKEAGVSHQAVSHTYKRHFHALVGQARQERQRVIAEQREAARVIEKRCALETSGKWRGQYVVEQAELRGFQVRLHPSSASGKTVKINGKMCRIHRIEHVTAPNGPANVAYYHNEIARTTLDEVEFMIFHCNSGEYPERIFIVPSRALKQRFEGREQRRSFYFPTKKRGRYHNSRPKIDFWRYENRWDLLR